MTDEPVYRLTPLGAAALALAEAQHALAELPMTLSPDYSRYPARHAALARYVDEARQEYAWQYLRASFGLAEE